MAIELKLPESQRDKGLLLGSIALIAGIGVYWYLVFSPKATELQTLRDRIDSLVVRNNTIRDDIAKGAAQRLKAEADEYGRMLAIFRQLVPVANEVPTLVDQVSNAAKQTGLDLGGIDPLGQIPGEIFDTYRYRMTVSGPYHRLAQFLNNVGNLTRIVAPMNLSLTPSGRGSTRIRPGEQWLDASFEIQTYVAKVGMPPAAPPGGSP
jgi:type IV pilus assembly protein PilO